MQVIPLNDNNLVESLIQGSSDVQSDALERTYHLFASSLLNHAFRILLDKEEAEDLIHDLFVGLEVQIKSKRPDSSLKNWLHGVVHRMALDRIAKRKRRSRLWDWFGPKEESSYQRDEFESSVETLLSTLDEDTRSLLWLHDAEGYTYEELSEMFQAPVGSLKSKLSRARKKLASQNPNLLKQWEDEK